MISHQKVAIAATVMTSANSKSVKGLTFAVIARAGTEEIKIKLPKTAKFIKQGIGSNGAPVLLAKAALLSERLT